MKITETIERECCQPQDMRPYKGDCTDKNWMRNIKPLFCIHCGQIWERVKDAYGDTEFIKYPLQHCYFKLDNTSRS